MSSGPSFFWFPGVAIFRSSKKKQKYDEVKLSGRWSWLGHPARSFAVSVYLILMSGLMGWSLLNRISKLLFIVVTVISCWALVLGVMDYQKFQKIKSLKNNPSPQGAAHAFNYLSTSQPEIRHNALALINFVSEETPRKVLKQSDSDVSEVAELLVQSLRTGDRLERQLAATAIKWYSRDYPQVFQPFSKELASFVEYQDSTVQTRIVISLGNVSRSAPKLAVSYAKAIFPAAKDEDPDVRQAAALALESINCEASSAILNRLAQDTAPNVRSQAIQSQQKSKSYQNQQ